jgi:hypothetical protein
LLCGKILQTRSGVGPQRVLAFIGQPGFAWIR